jgi:3-deoxy-D-manno-octulosonic-acid transferase
VQPGEATELTLREGDRALVAGSTHPGEEEVLIAAYTHLRRSSPELRLVIAPRHPERFAEVARLIAVKGFSLYRRSERTVTHEGDGPPVILVDTLGELVSMYRFADVVFVGGTLAPIGGHNVMEPAGLGKLPVVGPHTFRTTEAVELLQARDALRQVADGEELVRVLAEVLGDPEALVRAGRRARQVVIDNQGATARNLELLAGVAEQADANGDRRTPSE